MPFKLDGTISRVLGNIGVFIMVNLLCILFCIPFVTAGASITALHYVMLRFIHGESPNILSDFWKSFRENLRQGIFVNLVILAVALLLYTNLRFAYVNFDNGLLFRIAVFFAGAVSLLCMLAFGVIYPILARYTNTVAKTFYLAFAVALGHLPVSLLILLLNLVPVILFFLWPGAFLVSIPFYVFVGLSLVSYIDCLLLDRVFQKYES